MLTVPPHQTPMTAPSRTPARVINPVDGSRYLLDAAKVAVQPSIVHQALRVKACVACQLPAMALRSPALM